MQFKEGYLRIHKQFKHKKTQQMEWYEIGVIVLGSVLFTCCVVWLFLYILRIHFRGQASGTEIQKKLPEGCVVVITGANTGIGKVTALELSKRGNEIRIHFRDNSFASRAITMSHISISQPRSSE